MEQIKFRAKVKWNGNHYEAGQWVYGYYAYFNGMHQIYDCEENYVTGVGDLTRYEWVEIDENTLGQLSGFKDKHGKDLYQGDIYITYVYDHGKDKQEKYTVFIKGGAFCGGKSLSESMAMAWEPGSGLGEVSLSSEWIEEQMDIVGNIHDNQEMIDGK